MGQRGGEPLWKMDHPSRYNITKTRDTSLGTAYVVSNALDFVARFCKQGINNAWSLHASYISSTNNIYNGKWEYIGMKY